MVEESQGAEQSAPKSRWWSIPLLWASAFFLGWSVHTTYTSHQRREMVDILDHASDQDTKVCALVGLINGTGRKAFDACMEPAPEARMPVINPHDARDKVTIT
jgi:hypothetical protein